MERMRDNTRTGTGGYRDMLNGKSEERMRNRKECNVGRTDEWEEYREFVEIH